MTGLRSGSDDIEVVFVCTANRGRSPLAEQLLRQRVGGLPVRVRSRGLLAVGPAPALPGIVEAAHALGVELDAHRACALAAGELRAADLVIGFEPSHTAAAVVEGGAARDNVFTLGELAELLDEYTVMPGEDARARVEATLARVNAKRAGRDPFGAPAIEDPLDRSPQTVVRVAREIAAGVDLLASGLFAAASSTTGPERPERAAWRRLRWRPGRRRGGSSGRLSA